MPRRPFSSPLKFKKVDKGLSRREVRNLLRSASGSEEPTAQRGRSAGERGILPAGLPSRLQLGLDCPHVVKIYHWKGKPNFGDLVGGPLLKRFCGLRSEWATPMEAQLVMVGSVLEHLHSDYCGVIAGAGKLHEQLPVYFPDAIILLVRGKLTRDLLGLKRTCVGDPALLCNELVPLANKEFDLGIIPHWTDKELEFDSRFIRFTPKIIRVADDPIKVISEIGRCKRVVSSSLHGIIIADSFGIPRRIEIAHRMITHPSQEGGLFKWRDYSSGIGHKFKIGVMEQVDKNKIADKQSELFDVFERLKKIFK